MSQDDKTAGQGGTETHPPAPQLLIIDPAAASAADALAAAGYGVMIVTETATAVERFVSERPDLVLLNPAAAGLEATRLCADLRAAESGTPTPILVASEPSDAGAIRRAYDAGAADIVPSPVDWDRLIDRLPFILRNGRESARLKASEQRYALAARGSGDGIWDWDIDKDQALFSPRWCQMLGLHPERVGNHVDEWFDRVHPDDSHALHAALNDHLVGDSDRFQVEHRLRTRFGPYIWVLARGICVRNQHQAPMRIAGSLSDISERKRAETQLLHDALHDSLTGLPNRKLFLDRVGHSLRIRERRHDYRFAVCFIDLDRFKNINDSLGHLAGDELLIKVARAIETGLRQSDTLARLGGDEFAILFDDIDLDSGFLALIERVQHSLTQSIQLQDREITVTASIGVALSDAQYERGSDILRDADAAMYRAKAKGRATYEIFTNTMHARVSELLRIETELRHALARNELRVYFQPIVDLRGNRLIGFESLIRWQHPEQGLLEPGRFLEIAEESGLIVTMGRWLLTNSCIQMRAWQLRNPRLGDAYVSVNLSSREFAQPDLVDTVRAALQQSGLPTSCLKLEITESVLIGNPERARGRLTALKELGVDLSIDDFGTGYSSFSYLHKYPFDVLKIDKSFVQKLNGEGNARQIIRAIVELAHNLGMKVVAEGGEDLRTLDALRELGCEFAQGYHYSRPLPPQQLDDWIDSLDVE